MTDPFSVAASSFAVVGTADILLRFGTKLYQILDAIKDAPEEVERLRCCIHDNILLIEDLKRYLAELEDHSSLPSSPSAKTPNEAQDQFRSALRSLHRELCSLLKLAERCNELPKVWRRIKWVLDERKILRSVKNFETSKSTLIAALVLVGRRQDLLYQQRIERGMHQGFQKSTSNMDVQFQTLGQQLRKIQDGVSAGQTRFEVATFNFREQPAAVQNNSLSANRNAVEQHNKTRDQITRGNTKVIETICSKIQDLPANLAGTYLSPRKSNREIQFNGHNREAMLFPLLLLKPKLHRAIYHLLSQNSKQVSAQRLYWLESEFENLISSAIQEVAAISPGSTATPFDNWTYSKGTTSSLPTRDAQVRTPIPKRRLRYECELSNKTTESGRPVRRKRLKADCQSFSFISSVGVIKIMVPLLNCGSSNASNSFDVDEIDFLFSPNSDISSTSIHGRFSKIMDLGSEPQLYAQLNAFRIVESEDLYRNLFQYGTLEEIDTAFRVGKISPYDVNSSSRILCFNFAAFYSRVDVFQYFESQGMGPSNLKGEGDVLRALWVRFFVFVNFESVAAESPSRILVYLHETNVISLSHLPNKFLHASYGPGGPGRSCRKISALKPLLKILKEEEYDFEQKTRWGRTVLLRNLERRYFWVARLLLEFGANAHATTSTGLNALQCAMCGAKAGRCGESIDQMLSLLIKLGVDVNHCDNDGATPTDYARGHEYASPYGYDEPRYVQCWDEWCGALESNGLNIHEVTQANEERRKIFLEQKRQESRVDAEAEATAEIAQTIDWTK